MSNILKTILYVDDIHVYIVVGTTTCNNFWIQWKKILKKLKSWFDANKLTLDLSKTKYIIFGNHSNKTLVLNDVETERVNILE